MTRHGRFSTACGTAARCYDEAQIELAQALAMAFQNDAAEAIETLRAQGRLIESLPAGMPEAVHAYNSFDRANMTQYMQRIQAEAKRQGLSQQQLSLFSNSASKGGVGMDVDLSFREPPRFVTQAGKLVPNPAYQQWSQGLTQTMPDGTVVRLTPRRVPAQDARHHGDFLHRSFRADAR